MDLSKQKKEYLLSLCKSNGIKGYSKLKKEELIDKLVGAGVKNIVDVPVETDATVVSVKVVTKPRDTKPRLEKLNKKLEKFVSAEDHKETLFKLAADATDADILQLVKIKTDEFITSDTLSTVDYKKYVDDYGVMKAIVELLAKSPKTNLSKMNGEQIYNTLAEFIYENDTTIFDSLVKKLKKFTISLHKVKEVKEVKEKKSKVVVEEEDDQEEEDDNEDNEDDEEEEDDNEDEDDE